MKKIFTLIFGILFSALFLLAQEVPPQGISFKATIVNKSGNPISTKQVGLKISISENSEDVGAIVYSETFQPETNSSGQVDIVIGKGTPVFGDFNNIPWGEGEFYLHLDIDAKGGTNYHAMSVTKLLSVPYSFYSGNGFASQLSGSRNLPVLGKDGSVNIGSNSDGYNKLKVVGTLQVLPSEKEYWGSTLDLNNPPSNGGISYVFSSVNNSSGEGPGKLVIRPNAAEVRTLFIMDNFGHIGINNKSPQFNLDVTGDINFTGSLFKNGSPFSVDYNTMINKPTGNNVGDLLYWDGSNWIVLPVGNEGQVLTIKDGKPTWVTH